MSEQKNPIDTPPARDMERLWKLRADIAVRALFEVVRGEQRTIAINNPFVELRPELDVVNHLLREVVEEDPDLMEEDDYTLMADSVWDNLSAGGTYLGRAPTKEGE